VEEAISGGEGNILVRRKEIIYSPIDTRKSAVGGVLAVGKTDGDQGMSAMNIKGFSHNCIKPK